MHLQFCLVSQLQTHLNRHRVVWVENLQPPRLWWSQIQPSLQLISLYCMSANSNLTCVTFRHHLLQLQQHFLAEAALDGFPVFHTDSQNASAGGWPASLIESKGLRNTPVLFAHVVCSEPSFIIQTSLSALCSAGAESQESQYEAVTPQAWTLHHYHLITVFSHNSPPNKMFISLRSHCGGSSKQGPSVTTPRGNTGWHWF